MSFAGRIRSHIRGWSGEPEDTSVYSRLSTFWSQIRLIHLAPASEASHRIECKLSVISLNRKPVYEALSYVWGSDGEQGITYVDGKAVKVTMNLFNALSHLRSSTDTRIIWADALCINQADLIERGQQVKMMGRIYSQATGTVVWLGEAWEGCEVALEAVTELGRNPDLHLDDNLSPSLMVRDLPFWSVGLTEQLVRLFRLPWWRRVWTVQEFVLAKKVVFHLGEHSLAGESVVKWALNFGRHHPTCCNQAVEAARERNVVVDDVPECVSLCVHLGDFGNGQAHRNSLMALAKFREYQSTDQRDRVYGLLGLMNQAFVDAIKPDYTLSIASVFEQSVLATTKHIGHLEFLSHLCGKKQLDLPSYVPDWSAKVPHSWTYEVRVSRLTQYRASGKSVPVLQILEPGKIMTHGVVVDHITKVTESSMDIPIGDFVDQMRTALASRYASGATYSLTNEPIETAYSYTACAGLDLDVGNGRADVKRLQRPPDPEAFQKWEEWLRAHKNDWTGIEKDVAHIFRAALPAMSNRKFFISQNGLIGLGTDHCEVGDQIVLLSGGLVPYIVRSVPGTEDEEALVYNVLGDAYVHGIMDGEVWDHEDFPFRNIVLV